MSDRGLKWTWRILKVVLGLVPLLAGLDKFFNVFTHWTERLRVALPVPVPVMPEHLVHAVGVGEILIGLAILTRWTRTGALIAALWLVGIASLLVSLGGFYDVAIRDLLLAAAEFSLAQLTAILGAGSPSPAPARAKPSEGGLLRLNL